MTDLKPSLTGTLAAAVAFSMAVAGLAACSDDSTPVATSSEDPASTAPSGVEAVIDPGDDGDYQPDLVASDTVSVVDNPYLPLLPGSRWVYEGDSDGESERIEVEVLTERRDVMGISAVVVRDRAFVDGELAEDTLDFFTQDTEGNVWYLGEETAEYEGGAVTSTAGSWEAGVDGALPGIVMLAHPSVGDAYRQEFQAGDAEDMGEVLSLDGAVDVPAGSYHDVLTTRDWTPLEPEVIEEKQYAPGVGLVVEVHVAGGTGRAELVEFRAGSGSS